MTVKCSVASGPGEASEGKRKVGIKAFVRRGKACGQQRRKKNMALEGEGLCFRSSWWHIVASKWRIIGTLHSFFLQLKSTSHINLLRCEAES